MIEYQKMYCILCSAASQALDSLPDTEENRKGRSLLQEALLEAEDVYTAAGEEARMGGD